MTHGTDTNRSIIVMQNKVLYVLLTLTCIIETQEHACKINRNKVKKINVNNNLKYKNPNWNKSERLGKIIFTDLFFSSYRSFSVNNIYSRR